MLAQNLHVDGFGFVLVVQRDQFAIAPPKRIRLLSLGPRIRSRFCDNPSSHVQSHFSAAGHAFLRLPIPSRSPDRDPGPPSSACGVAPFGTKAPQTVPSRPDAVGLVLTGVERLTVSTRHRQARDSYRLASQGVP